MAQNNLLSLTPNTDGYYRYTFRYEGRKYDFRSKDLLQLVKKVTQKQTDLERGRIVSNSNTTVQQWAYTWLQAYKADNVSVKWYKSNESLIRLHIVPYIGGMRLKDVRQIDLQQVLNNLSGASYSQLHKLHCVLRQIFHKAYRNSLIERDISEDLVLPKYRDGTHRTITAAERAAILNLAEHHFAGLWIKLMLYTGLRPGETAALLWSDIDFQNKIIHVSKTLGSGTNAIKAPKTKAGVRDVPIPDVLFSNLKDAYQNRGTVPNPQQKKNGEIKKLSFDTGEYQNTVFTQQMSLRPLTAESMNCYWESFKRALDIEMGAKVYRNKIIESVVADDLTPYCLRHTYCTDLQDAGIPINIAKYFMGHSSIEMTARIYTHHTEQATAQAINLIK